MNSLEQKDAGKERERADQTTVENIRRACARFMAATPDYLPSPENERWMFWTMEQHDHLSPTSAASWAECFAICRERLKQRPAVRRQPIAPVSQLTEAEIDTWSAKELQKQIESSPRRAAEIEAALSRR